jgi:hypothetical protein
VGLVKFRGCGLALVLLLSASAYAADDWSSDDCDCPGAGGGYVLKLPDDVDLGGEFETCITAPPGSLVFLLISADDGPIQTQYGPLNIGVPIITSWVVLMSECGQICLDHAVECDPAVDGFTGYFQFIAFGPGPGQVGISNPESLTAHDDGDCIPPGDYFTYTQGAWGSKCAGNNVGCLRDEHFDAIYDELIVGDPDGDDADKVYAIVLTSSQAVEDLLPVGGSPDALDEGDEVDEDDSEAGGFASQLIAARLNVDFDDAGAFDDLKGQTSGKLGDLILTGGVDEDLEGFSVRELITLSEKAISKELEQPFDVDGDGEDDVDIGDLHAALATVNENFDNGTVNQGNLKEH